LERPALDKVRFIRTGSTAKACSRGHRTCGAFFGSSAALTLIIQLAIRAALRTATRWSAVRRLIRNADLETVSNMGDTGHAEATDGGQFR
jgi:hypothetical protein